jgi:hypothetical protein
LQPGTRPSTTQLRPSTARPRHWSAPSRHSITCVLPRRQSTVPHRIHNSFRPEPVRPSPQSQSFSQLTVNDGRILAPQLNVTPGQTKNGKGAAATPCGVHRSTSAIDSTTIPGSTLVGQLPRTFRGLPRPPSDDA